jgi:hypothetical protein
MQFIQSLYQGHLSLFPTETNKKWTLLLLLFYYSKAHEDM